MISSKSSEKASKAANLPSFLRFHVSLASLAGARSTNARRVSSEKQQGCSHGQLSPLKTTDPSVDRKGLRARSAPVQPGLQR